MLLPSFWLPDPRLAQLVAQNQRLLLGQQEILGLLNEVLQKVIMSETVTQQMDAAIAALQTDVTAQSTVIASATTLIQGFAAALQTAIANSQNSGATPAELASVIALHASLTTNTQTLSDAVAADPLPGSTPAPAPAPAAPAG
jgi:hypothetical protein